MLALFQRFRRGAGVEGRREEALATIRSDRDTFLAASFQADASGSTYSPDLIKKVFAEYGEIEKRLTQAIEDEIETLKEKSEELCRLRAYLYSSVELVMQGTSAVAEMGEEWYVPPAALATVKQDLVPKLANADLAIARGALREIFEFYDYWSWYVEEYNKLMRTTAAILLGIMVIVGALALNRLIRGDVVLGLVLSGACGALVSVLSKLPGVSVSGEKSAYIMRVISRVGTGLVASVIGCGLLSSGILTIPLPDGGRVSEIVERCGRSLAFTGSSPRTTVPLAALTPGRASEEPVRMAITPSQASSPQGGYPCPTGNLLILMSLAMLFGFSERALTSFEERIFPSPKEGRPASPTSLGTKQ